MMTVVFRKPSKTKSSDGIDSVEKIIHRKFIGPSVVKRLGESLFMNIKTASETVSRYNCLKVISEVQRAAILNKPYSYQLLLILRYLVNTLPIKRAWVMEYNHQDERLEYFGSYVTNDASTFFPRYAPRPKSVKKRPIWYSLMNNTIANVKDIYDDPLVNPDAVYASFRIRSFVSIPLWDSYGPVGILILDNKMSNGHSLPVDDSIVEDEVLNGMLSVLTSVVEFRRFRTEFNDRFGNAFNVISTAVRKAEHTLEKIKTDDDKDLCNQLESVKNFLKMIDEESVRSYELLSRYRNARPKADEGAFTVRRFVEMLGCRVSKESALGHSKTTLIIDDYEYDDPMESDWKQLQQAMVLLLHKVVSSTTVPNIELRVRKFSFANAVSFNFMFHGTVSEELFRRMQHALKEDVDLLKKYNVIVEQMILAMHSSRARIFLSRSPGGLRVSFISRLVQQDE